MLRGVLFASFVFLIPAQAQSCPDKDTKEALMKETVKSDITKLLAHKEFIDVFRLPEFAKTMSCSMTKFSQADGGIVKAIIHNIAKDGVVYKFRDNWKEDDGTGVIHVKGFAHDIGEYEEVVYILYADENAFAYYSCSPELYHTKKFFRAAISMENSKKDDPAAKKSVETAKEKMEQLESIIGPMKEFSGTNCPATFPLEPPAPSVQHKHAV